VEKRLDIAGREIAGDVARHARSYREAPDRR
jgi:hypothetical protein